MNLLFTSVGNVLTLESQTFLTMWRTRYHQIVAQMPMERIANYLHFDPGSTLALIDAIVCMADTDIIAYEDDETYPPFRRPAQLQRALAFAKDVRDLPDSCTMRDGRKWRSIPFAIFCDRADMFTMLEAQRKSHAKVFSVAVLLQR